MIAADPDAAFFEDWTEWRALDSLPLRPMTPDQYGVAPMPRRDLWRHPQHSRYYCMLLLRHEALGGGAGFELHLPPSHRIVTLVDRLPGAKRHPRVTAKYPNPAVAQSGLQHMRWVPAAQWRALRAVLPQIKALTTAWVMTPR